LVSDAEVDRWQLCSLPPPVQEEIVFLEDNVDFESFEGDAVMLEDDNYILEDYNKKPLTAEANLANMGTLQKGKVKRRKRDQDGNPVGRRHDNPLLDTSEYEVEFLDGASGTELVVPTLLWQTG
jgi:hypothetical protein